MCVCVHERQILLRTETKLDKIFLNRNQRGWRQRLRY